jgi:DNA transposition AAA+ family ATPase
MKDPDKNLLGGFLKRWKEKDKLSAVFVDEAKRLISTGFDQIIGLESGKIKPKGSK